jgi:hypothetical protein|tara:strand:+ start:224 stop:577 length:354 start_codon:yes stop_codon:yes gene_type:complete
MTSAYGYNPTNQDQLDTDVQTACTYVEFEDVKAKFKLTCDESNWNAIAKTMASGDTFELHTHDESYLCVYDKEISEYFAWLTDANFVEIFDVLPSRLISMYHALEAEYLHVGLGFDE